MKLYLVFFFLCINLCHGQHNFLKINNSLENDYKIKDFGLRLSKSYASGKNTMFLNSILPDTFYQKVILHDNNNQKLSTFNTKFKKEYTTKLHSFSKEIIQHLKDGNFYNFVSYHFDPIDKTYHIVFRYYSEKTGIDYHDYRILHHKENLVIDDVFIYSTGQKLSEAIKLFYLSEIPKTYILAFSNNPDYKYILMLKNFVDANVSNNHQKAYRHISLLNKSLQYKDRFVAMLKLEASRNIDEEAYFESMEEVLHNFKSDPSTDLSAIRYHYLNKDYETVFKCLNNIQNHTNDSFLDFEKGNLSFATKNYESATVFYKKMIENYPSFHLPKFSLLAIYEQENKTDNAIQLLDIILNTSSYKKATLIKKVKNQLPHITNSKAFKNWKKTSS